MSLRREALVSPKHQLASEPVPRRRMGLYVIAVVAAIASIIVLTLFSAGFFALGADVEIMTSTLRSGSGPLSNYRWVAVDVSLYNPGWSRRLTVWAEITCQRTQVSYSKGQYVRLGFKESKEVTVDFTLDNTIDYGEFTHRAWVTYIEQD
ncbi:MAG: hypothetical protein JSV64_02340 [Candidatus Bathyarchaeota archaeon]|nr:MAG: hypothetical protein JSV64_02340 [Candidatus Bathyarchaeota archaeon]